MTDDNPKQLDQPKQLDTQPDPASQDAAGTQSPPDPLSQAGAVSQALTADVPEKEVELNYPTYNDPNADAIVGALKAAKVTPEAAAELFKEAVQSGDVTKVNREQLEKALGKDGAELTLLRMEKMLTQKRAYVQEVVTSLHEVMGSKEHLDTVLTWAKARAAADPAFAAEYQEYVQMFDASKVKAKLAAEALKQAYQADPNNSSLGVKMVNGDKAVNVIPDTAELNRTEYLAALKRAHAEGNVKEVDRLNNIRLRTMRNSNKDS